MRSVLRSWLARTVPRPTTAGGDRANPPSRPSATFGPDEIDAFVDRTDALGPIGSPAVADYWAEVAYVSSTVVDEKLDPYSDAYTDQQIALYREISGRDVDQERNEMTAFAAEAHVAAANPYAHQPPPDVALHMSRIARAIQRSGLGIGDHVLDLGCGWGLSCELLAFSGLRVTGVDINPDFVTLVNRRAERSGWPIRARQGTFDAIPGTEVFDAALYYECLHHAVRPWVALGAAFERLKPGGRVILVGEPVNDRWKTWGLRVDNLSVYCIRKFGWFESGWSVPSSGIASCAPASRSSIAATRAARSGGSSSGGSRRLNHGGGSRRSRGGGSALRLASRGCAAIGFVARSAPGLAARTSPGGDWGASP